MKRRLAILILGWQLTVIELFCPEIQYLRGQRLHRRMLSPQILLIY